MSSTSQQRGQRREHSKVFSHLQKVKIRIQILLSCKIREVRLHHGRQLLKATHREHRRLLGVPCHSLPPIPYRFSTTLTFNNNWERSRDHRKLTRAASWLKPLVKSTCVSTGFRFTAHTLSTTFLQKKQPTATNQKATASAPGLPACRSLPSRARASPRDSLLQLTPCP